MRRVYGEPFPPEPAIWPEGGGFRRFPALNGPVRIPLQRQQRQGMQIQRVRIQRIQPYRIKRKNLWWVFWVVIVLIAVAIIISLFSGASSVSSNLKYSTESLESTWVKTIRTPIPTKLISKSAESWESIKGDTIESIDKLLESIDDFLRSK